MKGRLRKGFSDRDVELADQTSRHTADQSSVEPPQ
jgi:hypothetical protein